MTETAILAAGCFWGVQFYFDQVPGVVSTIAGYTGGRTENPSYEDVCYRNTGHAEAVFIEFDPKQVNYVVLLKHFFRLHDPTQLNRQGPDVGDQYRSAIFYADNVQQDQAVRIRNELQADFDQPIVTDIASAGKFYAAEPYHQKFTERTGRGMCHVSYQPL